MEPGISVYAVVTSENKYSMNAVIAALDISLPKWRVKVFRGLERESLLRAVDASARRGIPAVVLASFMTTQLANDEFLEWLLWLNKELKRHAASMGGKLITIAGGPHPSGDPYGSLSSLYFDYVVPGEGEEALPPLLELLSEGYRGVDLVRELSRLGKVAIYYEGEVYYRGRGKNRVSSLDSYPPFPVWRMMLGPIEIMRGCPFACRYCEVSYVFGARPRYRSPQNIEEWLDLYAQALEARGKRPDARFIAPDAFAYDRDPITRREKHGYSSLIEVLDRVKRKHRRMRFFLGSFPSEVRPDSVDEEKVRMSKPYMSNKRVIVGAQSGSDRILKLVNRGHTVEDVENSIVILNSYGFQVDVDFILGLPGETVEDVEATLWFAERLVERYKSRIHMHTFLPLPGTPFADAPPGRIPGWALRRLEKLVGRGLLYGDWRKQEALAAKIALLREKGLILTPKRVLGRSRIKYL